MDGQTSVTVAGVCLPRVLSARKSSEKNAPVFVYKEESSPYYNLQQLALAVSCHSPVLLQGPVGSGKTSTVEYLAHITGHILLNDNENCSANSPLFLKVQLGEQTDSRVLLGGYQCTEIPGQFVWKPGVLTQAVIKGYWLLLEDIDCTSSDVVTVIDNLVKTQSLVVPGYSDNVIPHNHFQLFATQRTLRYDFESGVKNNVLKNWITIQLKPLTNAEIVHIISKKYPKLINIASRMVSILDLEFPLNQVNVRIPSVRDILKWCNRCEKYYVPSSTESALQIFHDAVDIFCGFIDKGTRFTYASQIGVKLGIVKNKANFISSSYKPNIVISANKLLAGRSCLERIDNSIASVNIWNNNIFSLTTQSCCLIEKISCCLENNEPILLVGETGCGKTTVLQYIANLLGKNLVVINMNQQSDTADLVGGFRPVTFKWIMKPFCEKFETLFRNLFDPKKNVDCLNKFSRLLKKENWDVLLKFIIHVQKKALNHIESRLKSLQDEEAMDSSYESESDVGKWEKRLEDWKELGASVEKYSKQREPAQRSLVFSFIEGSLVSAMRKGHWVLLDEINLANSETLDCLSGLLENSRESISLLEKGDSRPVFRDSGFRLFAAMNPATDVGKKQLPIGLRNRFTELFIDELDDQNDLLPLIEAYLTELNQSPAKLKKIVKFYLKVKKGLKNEIFDGNGKKPHYSLRNLCRALMITSRNPCGTFARSLYEGLSVSFLTQLDSKSYKLVEGLIKETVTDSDMKAILNKPIPKPPREGYINLEGFWLSVGSLEPSVPDNYILTPTVQRHFRDLIKIVSLGSGIPILLEGDTSVGKTSLISYLAKCTGNVCSRVNNHEHTDIQEYIGTYVADAEGKLVFKEGILCEAMRKGHWLILDELNLAPTEVLEALNRVLDDNRELYIPETQKTIRAHDKFLLFATQNPPGLYSGRKELSRAFRNRFIELQFNQIPSNELTTILEKRCQLPLSYAKKMVGVMTELQLRRRGSDIFVGKSGFITLRDLFRWGERYQKAKVDTKFHDWEQHIGDEGYLLLAGRVRLPEECEVIEEVIAKFFKRKPNPENLFSLHENTSDVSREILEKLMNHSHKNENFRHIVWTYSMRRLAVLVCKALDFFEPVLIVGETGCGKTSVVQLLSSIRQKELYSVNCHMHSESADFLGGLRPVRNEARAEGKLFEWCDGPLVQAMTTGSFFLADEISLADDSVLERLNSLLEPERTILLAEKGGGLITNADTDYVTVAEKDFQFIGTMNPGGDYGKKELSPALRNRFTEIWADATLNKFQSYSEIIVHNLKFADGLRSCIAKTITSFLSWFETTETGKRVTLSVRDVLTWIRFMNDSDLDWFESCVHGVCLTFLDGLGTGSGYGRDESTKIFKKQCIEFLTNQLQQFVPQNIEELNMVVESDCGFIDEGNKVGIHPFYIAKGKWKIERDKYVFNAPTTFENCKRVLRGLGTKKAILLEGSPGVGKTSLISSLAKASGYNLTRINLSDQTDISDLFGADLPEEGGSAGHFVWRDGPFLRALKEGHWILLDELNLASQSVLEGLNAVLDHRGSVYIPELNKTFYVSTETRLFGCQNPIKEGGDRRGLPKSFLNRFTQVYVEPITESDYAVILRETFPALEFVKVNGEPLIGLMIRFTSKVCGQIAEGAVGAFGGPWELNLRDMTRWAEGVLKDLHLDDRGMTGDGILPDEDTILLALFKHVDLLYAKRFRGRKDREVVHGIFESLFGAKGFPREKLQVYVTENFLFVGDNMASVNNSFFYGDLDEFEMFVDPGKRKPGVEWTRERKKIQKICANYHGKRKLEELRLLEKQYPILSCLCQCVNMNWLAILVGESGSGKTSSVRTFAALRGQNLRIMSCNSAMDTTEILGSFEQTDYNRHLERISDSARIIFLSAARRCLRDGKDGAALSFVKKWSSFRESPINDDSMSVTSAFELFHARLNLLLNALSGKELQWYGDLKKSAENLVSELQELKMNLSSIDCLTFAGKFEWVDSLLVKSIKDGSWLLVEDVNLCSNAVLDRLNGLLEPNGCLTIGERGAGADGQIITVTPHPNFRLFFTMDPRNGTISRAMRNRGVEIYCLPDEGINSWPKLDLIPLLNDMGIEDVEMHKALIEVEARTENQNICNLIANGFWTAQYVKHKFSKSEAFRKSSKHIYKSTEQNFIEELAASLNGETVAFDVSLMRPPSTSYIVDAKFSKLKQSCALLHLIIELCKTGVDCESVIPGDILEYFFGTRFANLKILLGDFAKFNLLHVFLTASGDALTDLSSFVKELASRCSDVKVRNNINELLIRFDGIICMKDEFPWDKRWFENIERFFDFQQNNVVNKAVVLMRFLFGFCAKVDSDGNKDVTVEKYSQVVEQGHSDDLFPFQPILSQFSSFLKEFDELTVETLKCDQVRVTDDEAKWFMDVMKWRFRLGDQGKLILLSGGKKKILNEDAVTLVELHLFWFLKLIPFGASKLPFTAFSTVPEYLRKRFMEFYKKCAEILSTRNSTKLIKMCNVFRKSLGHSQSNKFIPEEEIHGKIEEMVIDETPKIFLPDRIILRSLLNQLVERFNANLGPFLSMETLSENGTTSQLGSLKSLLVELKQDMKWAAPLLKLLKEFSMADLKDRPKLTSELVYVTLKTLNADFAFAEDLNDETKKVLLDQILPYHRPVWTCRILNVAFDSNEMWKLSSYQKSQNNLNSLLLTALPNIVHPLDANTGTSLLDSLANERTRVKFELSRIMNGIRKCLGIENGSIREYLNRISEESNVGIEKMFYGRLNSIIGVLIELNLDENSGYESLGCYWLLLGLLEMLFLREGKIDPIRKKLIKADYVAKEAETLNSEILALEMYSAVAGISLNHYYAKSLSEYLSTSRKNLSKYRNLDRVKRNPASFREICKEMESFMTTFDEIFRFCGNVREKVFYDHEPNTAQHLYRKGRFIVTKNISFTENLRKYCDHFGDFVYPILAASSQIEHGMNIIMSEIIRRPYSQKGQIESFTVQLCRFPAPPKNHLMSLFQNLEVSAWPREALKSIETNKLLILFSSCLIKYNEWLYYKNESTYCELMAMFSMVVEFWTREEERKRKEEIEKESLYLKRGTEKCKTLTEEEEFAQEQLKLFPTFEHDFDENLNAPDSRENVKPELESINDEHLGQVSRLHMKIVKAFVDIGWASGGQSSLAPDLFSPLCMRFSMLSKLLPHVSYLLTQNTDRNLISGLLVLLKSKDEGRCMADAKLLTESDCLYDFYRDKNVEEVGKCLEILQELSVKLNELLSEWPDHPTLIQIKVIIDRILTFSIDSPVMRFLTGLELLLQNCQNWESVAHAQVSIADHLVKITNLIIEWRKLELQGWKNCLQAAHERIRKRAFKWWFHFWCLIEEYLTKEESETEARASLVQLLQAVYNFIELSPAGEFDARLEIVLSYHYHALHLPRSRKRDALCIALWNIHAFYQQFSADVARKLNASCAPISKKLREFVKIASWHDITYWSVKQAIEKSHRTLLKCIKEYEVFLKERVDLKSFDATRREGEKKKKKGLNMDVQKFLRNVEKSDFPFETTLRIADPEKKFEKAQKFANEIVLRSQYPSLISSLDEFVGTICESTQHFAGLDVDRSLAKEKQKSQAKNIVHQKRRAVADLFKTLQRIGLSYRTGLNENFTGVIDLCDAPPMNYQESKKCPPANAQGEEYYLKSLLRKLVIENSLLNPSKEIGPQVIERLRGFSGHFLDFNKKQKIKLSETMAAIGELRGFESALATLATKSSETVFIPNQSRFAREVNDVREKICRTCYIFQQFGALLDSWPASGGSLMKELNFSAAELTPALFTASKSDSIFVTVRKLYEELSTGYSNLARKLERDLIRQTKHVVHYKSGVGEIRENNFTFYTVKHAAAFDEIVAEFKTLAKNLQKFSAFFNGDGSSISSHLTDCLSELQSLPDSCQNYIPLDESTDAFTDDYKQQLSRTTDSIIEEVLLSIQRLVKKAKESVANSKNIPQENLVDKDEDEIEESGDLLDNHLDKKLIEGLHADVDDLKIDEVNNLLGSLFGLLSSLQSDLINGADECLRIVSKALPFLRRYSILCSYFVNQLGFCYMATNKLSSVLFGTFIQIAQKGFCAPPEFDEDGEDDGKEGWLNSEVGGFTGDDVSKGQKDVSDKIESEDQLEDARPKGSEKDKEANEDCKEEENGIEVSENFDGKAQDIDKQNNGEDENEEDSRDEDEEEPDMEMGETDKGADNLDSELWSESECEDEDEDNKEKKEESGGGEDARNDKHSKNKDEDDDVDDDNGEEDGKKEKKKKEKDINDMEDNEDDGDQIDPYHGKHQPEQEPEPLDLPDNMQLDEGDAKDEEEGGENPFDIDAMKDKQPKVNLDEDEPEQTQEQEEKEGEKGDSSDSDESENDENANESQKPEEMAIDENSERDEESDEGEDKKYGGDERSKEEGGEEKEDEEKIQDNEFHPSDDRPSEMAAQPAPQTNQNEAMSCDQVVGSEENRSMDTNPQEIAQESEMKPKGAGQAEMEQMKQGRESSASRNEKLRQGESQVKRERKRERPGKSDDDRCLGDEESKVNKKLKTLDRAEEKEDEESAAQNEESDLYQHVSERVLNATQVVDAATKEQAERQPVPKNEEGEEPEKDEPMAMDVDGMEEEFEKEDVEKGKSEVEGSKAGKNNNDDEGEMITEETKLESTGEIVQTMTVERGSETTFHTKLSALSDEANPYLNPNDIQSLRLEIQQQLLNYKQCGSASAENVRAWHMLTSVVESLARDLSEQLRLILEPTQATRLKGDYRTGRRINMRKVIAYIASEFRKDSIWLRRTKPWKRDHEIVLAIDDSSSMCHNESQELAFESLALVFKALGLIEAGRLGVLSFGEKTKIVHRLGDTFTDDTGARLLQEFTFEQKKTLMCEMLNVSTAMMTSQRKSDVAQLLLIISDGRGVFSEGLDKVKMAVRRATDSGIFVVFIIIDNPKSKDSIMDIRMPEFKDGQFIGIKSYMELFPFPYYLILRNIAGLPNTLSDALRQWFQLITSRNLSS